MSERIDQIDSYLDGELPQAQAAELRQWINADPANARVFAERAVLHQEIRSILHRNRVQTVQNPHDILKELLEHETNAQADLVEIIDLTTSASRSSRRSKTFRLVFTNPMAISGIAALVILSVSLFLIFDNGADTPRNDSPRQVAIDPAPPQTVSTVATLTATHNAQWAERALVHGEPLYAGDSLTLTVGFAEITTIEGTAVLLEAPCAIQFDEQGNALRLQRGKLSANVPPQAVGFTVHTPTARVIDYGTQFGVDVREDGTTHTAVFTGEVELSELSKSQDQPARNVRLTEGWSSQVSRRGVLNREPKAVSAKDHGRFAKSIDEVIDPAFAYRRAVLASKPVVYWGFDEDQANTRNLAGQSDYNGHAIGEATRGEGLFGSALKLTGQAESMGGFASENPLSLKDAKAYTLEAWCWIERPHHGRVLALAQLEDDLSFRPKHFGMIEVMSGSGIPAGLLQDQDSIRFLHRNPPSFDSGTGSDIFSNQAAPIGQWVHLVAVKDGKKGRVYLDGKLVAASNDNQPIATDQPIGLFVGISPMLLRSELSASPTDFRPFAGRIDEVAVYDLALSHETIRRHFSLGQSRVDD